jgi:serine protease Do
MKRIVGLALICSAFLFLGLWPVSVCQAQDTASDDFESRQAAAINAAVDKAAPAVVRIETFGGLEKVGEVLLGAGPTTGVLVDPEGYVLSSAFNFIRKPASILVSVGDGQRAPAEIVARDHSRMLVLLKIKSEAGKRYPTAEVAPRKDWRVGQWAVALGRTFSADDVNISAGILSATNRVWGRAVQTDAKVSPANYGGPLIDLDGRVIGILAPMSPNAEGEVAGAEWYDSGIGFAVPLEDVMPQLPKLKAGEDVHRGLLGVALERGNVFADRAKVAAAPANSPAAKAGLKKGDVIIRVDDTEITRQAELRHALGGKYAGETVSLTVVRGADQIEASAVLVSKLQAYVHPFLGVLPDRALPADDTPGVPVRYVYPGGPAAAAGLRTGDRITALEKDTLTGPADLRDGIAAFEPNRTVRITYVRGGAEATADVQLGMLPEEMPADLPAARVKTGPPPDEMPAVGEIDVKLAEEPNECTAYVPENYHPERSHGVLVWLHAAGRYDKADTLKQWRAICDERDLILIVPKAAKDEKWNRTEAELVQKVIDEIAGDYSIDPTRVVVGGHQAGGAMAFLAAFTHSDLIRGVISVDAPLPANSKPPANDPVNRLAIAVTTGAGDKADAAEAGVKKLRANKFPVTVLSKGDQPQQLSAEDRAALGRWIDSLDRI